MDAKSHRKYQTQISSLKCTVKKYIFFIDFRPFIRVPCPSIYNDGLGTHLLCKKMISTLRKVPSQTKSSNPLLRPFPSFTPTHPTNNKKTSKTLARKTRPAWIFFWPKKRSAQTAPRFVNQRRVLVRLKGMRHTLEL